RMTVLLIEGQGHAWSGSTGVQAERLLSPTMAPLESIQATDLVWEHFQGRRIYHLSRRAAQDLQRITQKGSMTGSGRLDGPSSRGRSEEDSRALRIWSNLRSRSWRRVSESLGAGEGTTSTTSTAERPVLDRSVVGGGTAGG